mgnify:CR=1 FL=1
MNVIYPDLNEKKILITGAMRGIGRAVAHGLAAQGAFVVFNYREGKQEQALEFEKELKEKGASGAKALAFDITRTEQMKSALEQFAKDVGPIEGLINNAGISKDQLFLRLKEEDLQQMLDTNLRGSMMLTQVLSRSFLRGKNVSIVNLSSVVGLMGNPSQAAYAASKAGLIGFTKSFAKELASKNVRCNAICPGFIETDMTETLDERVKEQYLSEIPMKRFGKTQEITNLVCFLLSQASSYITGEVIKIDGGIYI